MKNSMKKYKNHTTPEISCQDLLQTNKKARNYPEIDAKTIKIY